MKEKEIKVSICCICYNQKEFIRNTIESFLSQKCNFNYEIIIHDDCSTDGTTNILKEYEKKYPDLIHVIYQQENQYSKKKKVLPFTFSKAKGEYVALCEGDDFWIDNEKLQKQVNYMDINADCSMCFHNAYVYNQLTHKKSIFLPSSYFSKQYFKINHCYNAGEIELIGFIPTASMLIRTQYLRELPDWYYKSAAGDIAIKLHVTSKGYAYYLDDIMSVYRIQTGISVMDSWAKLEIKKKVDLENNHIQLIETFDKETRYAYHNNLQISIDMRLINLYSLLNDSKSLRQKKFKYIIKKLNKIKKIQLYLIMYFPIGAIFLKKIKRNMR